jgi:hypothetical protein
MAIVELLMSLNSVKHFLKKYEHKGVQKEFATHHKNGQERKETLRG